MKTLMEVFGWMTTLAPLIDPLGLICNCVCSYHANGITHWEGGEGIFVIGMRFLMLIGISYAVDIILNILLLIFTVRKKSIWKLIRNLKQRSVFPLH